MELSDLNVTIMIGVFDVMVTGCLPDSSARMRGEEQSKLWHSYIARVSYQSSRSISLTLRTIRFVNGGAITQLQSALFA